MLEAEGKHFGCGLIRRPVIKSNAVGGDEYAGAVLTKLTMDENFLRRRLAKESEELSELRRSRIGETADGNGNKMNAERFGAGTFLFADVMGFAA